MKKYLTFLLLSYPTALFFEFLANTIGDGTLFQGQNWAIFFFLWYGFMYTVLFLLFRKRKLWQGVVFFAIFGNVVEILVFKRSHPIDTLIYALMGILPLYLYEKRVEKRK